MKTKLLSVMVILSAITALGAGCASMGGQGGTSGQDIAATGPTILNPRTNPSTFELNNQFQPMQQAEIFADVKDFKGNITNVRVRFIHVPLELKMNKVAGSTYRAELNADQLKELAVSGKTMKYEANVIASNNQGQTSMSKAPINIAVKTPDIAQKTG